MGFHNFKLNLDALVNSICHARMTLSGIHDFKVIQTGFPIKFASGMTICESINFAFNTEVACWTKYALS